MCGIVGIVGKTGVAQSLYDGLTVLQHRGQDAAGIMTIDQNMFNLRKANGHLGLLLLTMVTSQMQASYSERYRVLPNATLILHPTLNYYSIF